MLSRVRIAVIGAGVIGRTHLETIEKCEDLQLAAIVDPNEASKEIAVEKGVPWFQDVAELIDGEITDAAIVASPNDTHVSISSKLMKSGIPVLLEKPVSNTAEFGRELLSLEKSTGVPILIGHHRRHNPIIKAAKAAIEEGMVGKLVVATVMSAFYKPRSYFETPWRKTAGQGGPLLINLIHEIDLLRHFWGEVIEVNAITSHEQRGLDVEDTAVAILKFSEGGIASLALTDAGASPWAWDVSAGENLGRFPVHESYSHAYSCTNAALSIPDLSLWRYPESPDWTTQMRNYKLAYVTADPYVEQLKHFRNLILGESKPIVTCLDGLNNMLVIEAIKKSAETGQKVTLDHWNN
jgi:predicted dehydrogenase